jgi:predicted RecA/RadA family phage recombinase
MSKNLVYAGHKPALSLPVPSGTKSGDPVLVGGIVGVAETDRAATTNGVRTGGVGNPDGYASVAVDGVYSLPCTDAVAAAGTKIYITGSGPFTLTTTATSNTLFGVTVPVIQRGVASGATKSSGAGNVNVAITPTV